MEPLLLLCGHLVGDYILQNDWQAKYKAARHPGSKPLPETDDYYYGYEARYGKRIREWEDKCRASRIAPWACTIHCFFYTLSVWAFSFWWMPWWGLLICFSLHWPIDRFRLAKLWMVKVSGQKEFANGPLSPWSIIIVDNVFHILTLAIIGQIATLK